VMYQPESVLVRHPGASARPLGDEPEGTMQRDFERFTDKWFARLRAGQASVG
jgi:hypothetical protein